MAKLLILYCVCRALVGVGFLLLPSTATWGILLAQVPPSPGHPQQFRLQRLVVCCCGSLLVRSSSAMPAHQPKAIKTVGVVQDVGAVKRRPAQEGHGLQEVTCVWLSHQAACGGAPAAANKGPLQTASRCPGGSRRAGRESRRRADRRTTPAHNPDRTPNGRRA